MLEFSQYLAAPPAGLRLADLGARVIKIERPDGGDAGRQLATKNLFVDGDSNLPRHQPQQGILAANSRIPADLQR